MHGPQKIHLLYLEGLLRYLKKFKDLKLVYRKGDRFYGLSHELGDAFPEMGELHKCSVIGLSDANFAPAVKAVGERMRSTSGRCFFMFGFLGSWSSKRQSLTAGSTMQAELIAASSASDMGIWFHNFITVFPSIFGTPHPIPILIDNAAALSVANHPKHSPATRHICLREFRIRDAHEMGQVRPFYCPGTHNCADHFTKLLDTIIHSRLSRLLGMEGNLQDPGLPDLAAMALVSTEGEWNKSVDRQIWNYWRDSEGNLPVDVF